MRITIGLLALALLRSTAVAADGDEAPASLRPGEHRYGERIMIGNQTARYRLEGLLPDRTYEVRVSFPATNPVRVRLWLEPHAASADSSTNSRAGRRLLDNERIVFRTDAAARVAAQGGKHSEVDVLFQAQRWAVHVDGPGGAPKVLAYDIVLERNWQGIPMSSMPLLLTAVGLVALVVAVVPAWSGHVVPALLRWLQDGGGGGRRKRRVG